MLADGIDPLEQRAETTRAARRAAEGAADVMTFGIAAKRYISTHEASWKNAKHSYQWRQTIDAYARPLLGDRPIASIDTDLVVKVLVPIWATKTETATRLRGRMEKIFDWAKALKHRSGENPAAWKGNLDKLLPNPNKIAPVVNHPALPFCKMPDFMRDLRAMPGVAALALEFIILTAVRTGEALGAKWSEVDETSRIWTVPAVRMKAGREHRVPLSDAAMDVLQSLKGVRDSGDFLLPGRKEDSQLSNMSCIAVLRRMGRNDIVVHGFRSSFRDWAAEATNVPSEVAEMALAHAISNKVEAAYRRGDLFGKRTVLMQDWAKFCGSATL